MKPHPVVLGALGGIFALAICPAHADPMGDLCAIFNTERNTTATLERAIANEQNPLKKDSLQRQYSQIGQQKETSLDNYLRANQFRIKNFTGVVSAFRSFSYFQGPGVDLAINLPCKVTIGFRFLDARPEIGPPKPEQFASLSSWKPALENIVVNDIVTFSGRFTLEGRGLAGVLTELKKGGGEAYTVADPIAKPRVSHGGMTWTAVTFEESWPKANAYCANLNVSGETGWRMPTQVEIENMLRSGATNGKGWMTGRAWTTTPWPSNGDGWYSMVDLQNGPTYSGFQTQRNGVSCVRASTSAQPAEAPSQAQQSASEQQPRAEPTERQKAQRERMQACNAEAADKKGDERKIFMSSCLKDEQKAMQDRTTGRSQSATGIPGQRDTCVALLREQAQRYGSRMPQFASKFVWFGGTAEETAAMASRMSQLLNVQIDPGHMKPNYGRTTAANKSYRAGCVGYREDIFGTRDGAQCVVDLLGPNYTLSDSCRASGFPYNVIPAL